LPERYGWRLAAAPAFLEQYGELLRAVEAIKMRDPRGAPAHPKTKLLKRVLQLVYDEIPRGPNAREYQIGNTLGPGHRHWRRAKFLGRFRLFFRFNSRSRVIIYAWVNDENTLRKAGSRTDPYAVFAGRLRAGTPPDNWEDLIQAARDLPG
jgi:toxin YhaV